MIMARKAPASAKAEKTISSTLSNHTDDMWTKNPALIKSFLDAKPEFEQLCAEVEYILKKKVTQASIETSFLGSRAKTLNSFLEKLTRKSYQDPFNQIDDFAGARVVCLYNNDITKVIEIIRNEFDVAEEINKREELDTNKFGYIGHHFIVRLSEKYSGARYDDLRNLRCEIQVRTVVQDAWSIIQHHMVYKKESQVPSNLIRKLNGLAGLFETVDDQFEFIRLQRDKYLEEVRESKNTPNNFLENELNYDSLVEFVQWRYKQELSDQDRANITKVLDVLNDIGISSLKELEAQIERNEAFCKLAIDNYQKSFAKDDPNVPKAPIFPVINVALAVSANPVWRSMFPWGPTWSNALTNTDAQL
jgi:ppGpp synthetase/RelA/SpoT-type nucleotidyltranferase